MKTKEHGKQRSKDMKEEIHDEKKKKRDFIPAFLCYVSRKECKTTYFTDD